LYCITPHPRAAQETQVYTTATRSTEIQYLKEHEDKYRAVIENRTINGDNSLVKYAYRYLTRTNNKG